MVKVELMDLYKVKLEIAKIIMNSVDKLITYSDIMCRKVRKISDDTTIHEYLFNDKFTEHDLAQFASCINENKTDVKIAWYNAKESDYLEIPIDVTIIGLFEIYKYKICINKKNDDFNAQLLLR
jgi:hypothetical protein